jgi:hypothetical protein
MSLTQTVSRWRHDRPYVRSPETQIAAQLATKPIIPAGSGEQSKIGKKTARRYQTFAAPMSEKIARADRIFAVCSLVEHDEQGLFRSLLQNSTRVGTFRKRLGKRSLGKRS